MKKMRRMFEYKRREEMEMKSDKIREKIEIMGRVIIMLVIG